MNTAKSNAISDFFAPLIEGRTLAEIPPLVELAKKITHHKFRRGTIIFNKGDTLTGVFLVVSGQIKLTIPSCQGHDKVIDVIEPGNSFGEPSLFIDQPSPIMAEAITHSEVFLIPKAEVLQITHTHPEFTFHVLGKMCRQTISLINNLEACCTQTVRQRVACYLMENATAHSRPSSPLEVTLTSRNHVIASILHLTPETFSRELHQLVKTGLISIERRKIYLQQPDQLMSYCGLPEE